VDPNLYKLRDIKVQFYHHRREEHCVDFEIFLKTFLAAGYHYTRDDLDNIDRYAVKEDLRNCGFNFEEPQSLQQTCRSVIRGYMRTLNKDTSVFPSVEKLPIPESLKTYLKLCDIIDLKKTSKHCNEHDRDMTYTRVPRYCNFINSILLDHTSSL
jgi:hypothetical protein